ncbi:MAG TPA: FGGY family carbohydrate kinase [Patescibacteria group bacterium]|nr:FGGY family carbohydrate kinase [Patescibacteria group bacterium]
MKQDSFILTLDLGTTAIKAIVFDKHLKQVVRVAKEMHESRPRRGWVEQDPGEMLRLAKFVLQRAVKESGFHPASCHGLGIANQRETTILWNKKNGRTVYPAIVWKDKRTKSLCRKLRRHEAEVREKTGLIISPYFSAPKIQWVLEQCEEARQLAAKGQLLFGTVDSWILWNLCEGRPHVTDQTNASRTLLYNIRTFGWDTELLSLFRVPESILPSVLPSQAAFGSLKKGILGSAIPVKAVIGDQQASVYAAISAETPSKNATKVTFGTGTFIAQTLDNGFSLQKDFFTTLAPGKHGPIYIAETKIDHGGLEAEPILHQPKKLERFFFHLARHVDRALKKLPVKPHRIVVDGGVSRDGILPSIQASVSKITVQHLPIFDGTSYGTALLVRDVQRKS